MIFAAEGTDCSVVTAACVVNWKQVASHLWRCPHVSLLFYHLKLFPHCLSTKLCPLKVSKPFITNTVLLHPSHSFKSDQMHFTR